MSKSIQIRRYGGPDALEWKDVPTPPLSQDSVRVAVRAAGVNFADLMMRMGLYPEAPPRPFTPGYEIAGVVTETGAGVTRFKNGDRVLALCRFGGYTSDIVLPEEQLWKTPEHLSDVEAASIPVNFLCAWLALHEMARVRNNDRVLIPSAAGGVGIAAVQIASQAGAHVTGLVSSMEKAELVRSLGAERVLTYEEEQKSGSLYDIVLDATGGRELKRSFKKTAAAGRVVHFGVASLVTAPKRSVFQAIRTLATTPIFHPIGLMNQNKGIFGLNVLQAFAPDKKDLLIGCMNEIMRRFENHEFRPVVGKIFPLQQAGAAHSFLQSRRAVGKVVLTP